MADKPVESYIPGLPAGQKAKVPATQVPVAAINGVTGTDLQAVLEDLANRVANLEAA